MDIETCREYCLSLPLAEESFPFDDVSAVYKVCGKIFAIITLDRYEESGMLLKCDPDRAVDLRDRYPYDIKPGFHMNKTHWNTVLSGNLPNSFVRELIRHSYGLVVEKLPKKMREEVLKMF